MLRLYLLQPPEDYIVHGPNQMTALPMEVPVSYQEIAHCLEKSISKMEAAILSALEQTPPELYADIVRNGIYLAGGGALMRGLDKRLTDKINIPFHIAEDPLHAVAIGTGVALKNIDKFNFLIRIIQERQRRTDIDLDQFGSTFTHLHIVLAAHILHNISRQVISCN